MQDGLASLGWFDAASFQSEFWDFLSYVDGSFWCKCHCSFTLQRNSLLSLTIILAKKKKFQYICVQGLQTPYGIEWHLAAQPRQWHTVSLSVRKINPYNQKFAKSRLQYWEDNVKKRYWERKVWTGFNGSSQDSVAPCSEHSNEPSVQGSWPTEQSNTSQEWLCSTEFKLWRRLQISWFLGIPVFQMNQSSATDP